QVARASMHRASMPVATGISCGKVARIFAPLSAVVQLTMQVSIPRSGLAWALHDLSEKGFLRKQEGTTMTRTVQTLMLMGAVTAGLGFASACNKTPTEAHNDAGEAQREADKTASAAREQADKKANEAIDKANQQVAEANDDAREKAAKAQANANDKIREANRDMSGSQGQLQDWGQKRIDEVNTMIDDAKVKAQTAAPQ